MIKLLPILAIKEEEFGMCDMTRQRSDKKYYSPSTVGPNY
jgi:hypothetical protein